MTERSLTEFKLEELGKEMKKVVWMIKEVQNPNFASLDELCCSAGMVCWKENNFIVTSAHCLRKTNDVNASYENERTYTTDSYEVERLIVDDYRNIAVLRLKNEPTEKFNSTRLDTNLPGKDQVVYCTHHWSGFIYTSTKGKMLDSDLRSEDASRNLLFGHGPPVFRVGFLQTDDKSSGAPVFNYSGQMVGMVVGSDESKNETYVVPAKTIQEVLESLP